MNDSTITQNKLLDSYYALIGASHIDNIIEELKDSQDKIQEEVVPKTLDQWVHRLARNLVKENKAKIRRMKFRQYGSRVAVIALVLMTTIAVAGLSVDAIRVKFFNMMLEVEDQYTAITYKSKDEEMEVEQATQSDDIMDQATFEGNYYPTYVPDGYVEVDREIFHSFLQVRYEDGDGHQIMYGQSSLDGGTMIDTEDALVTYPEIKGIEGIMAEEDGSVILVWHNNAYSFSIIGEMDRSTALNMAESIKKE